MSVRILHAADFHLDSPFRALPSEKAVLRRHEQRALMEKLVETVRDEGAQIVLLAGDLLDSGNSYWETGEALSKALSAMDAEVFIAPGNHDYYTSRSPYAFMDLPENVHIFKTPSIKCVELPEYNCRIWGAGFLSGSCDGLLNRFHVDSDGKTLNIMVLHGDITGGRYNPITEEQIAQSGLDYLALGHIHAWSGIQKAGETFYAYPGCIEGRGFDETGEKGVISGTISRGSCDLRFVPMGGREYKVKEIDLTDSCDIIDRTSQVIGAGEPDNIVRIIYRGQYNGSVDEEQIVKAFGSKFFHLTVKDETRPGRGIWDSAGEDSLTGLFLAKLKASYEQAESGEKMQYLMAARYGLAALERREEWRP